MQACRCTAVRSFAEQHARREACTRTTPLPCNPIQHLCRLHARQSPGCRTRTAISSSTSEQEADTDKAESSEEFKGFGSPSARKVTRRKPPSYESRVKEGEAKAAAPPSQIERIAVSGLALGFVFILCEGLFLATSGFLPQGADEVAAKYVYPSFSPTVIGLVVCSAVFGLWKSRQEEAT